MKAARAARRAIAPLLFDKGFVMKVGRNDPCWCGSGQKYKKCHIDRDRQPAPTPWEVDALLRGERSGGACLYVEVNNPTGLCGKPAIASHSVPRKMLKQIARDGHVYYHSATLQDIAKADGRPLLKLIGVNRAWVHDMEVEVTLPGAPPSSSRSGR